jgi:hypothetical protein
MKSGICPKCEVKNVRVVDGNRTDVSVPTKGVFSSGAFTNFYVCGDCGYLEIYIEKKEDLPKINDAWEKVEINE